MMSYSHNIMVTVSIRDRGTLLIVVMWISLGLISIALYFGHSMMFEYRAADNSVAGLEAEHAIEGARRYLAFVIKNLEEPGMMPDIESYEYEEVPVGDATFWLIGRSDDQTSDVPAFGLTDEAAKLNINVATQEMLEMLPGMPLDLAAAIIDWRDEDSDITDGGAESETYLLLDPPYYCKNAPFESVDELRLVADVDLDIMYGEDVNRNGVLDPNEDDGDETWPDDNRDGVLDPGLVEYLTVYSREPTTVSNGDPKINIETQPTEFQQLMREEFGIERSAKSLLDYYVAGELNDEQFAQAEDMAVTRTAGLINVNTASAAVLACVPGIGEQYAEQLVAYRQGSSVEDLQSVTWVTQVLDRSTVNLWGPWLTTKSYQLTADIAALGHLGRGFRRTMFVFDTTGSEPTIVCRRDLTRFGWPLGQEIRERYLTTTKSERESMNERF
ncbi:MAG: general secretion pathway protein GspK [Candidatus Hydrogenedentes bacterium]|nr:general secretion pathway protein GspK [Candidatus Hydrogenedentota bacterium]